MTDFPDFYAVLGVPFGASASEIRDAYIKQAYIWHPDRNPGKDTHERMLRINEAYVILHDPATRERYDREYLRRQQMRSTGRGKYDGMADNGPDQPQSAFDEELHDLLRKAREKDAELNEVSFSDLMGMCGSAAAGCLKGAVAGVAGLLAVLFCLLLFGPDGLAALQLLMLAGGLLCGLWAAGRYLYKFLFRR